MKDTIAAVVTNGDTSIYSSNLQECLKEVYRYSHRELYNICEGTTQTIPYGFWDYCAIILFIIVMLFLAVALISVIKVVFE